MKKILLNTLLSATLLLGTLNNAYTMEDTNNCFEYTNEEKQNIRQKLLDKYKDELNKWDENFEKSLNQLSEKFSSIASKIDNIIEEHNIIIEAKDYKSINKIQNPVVSDIYNAYIQDIKTLTMLDKEKEAKIHALYSMFNQIMQSKYEFLNTLKNYMMELKGDIINEEKSIINIQNRLNEMQCNDKPKSNIEIQEINKVRNEYNKLEVNINKMKEQCQQLDNEIKNQYVLLDKEKQKQKLEEGIFNNMLDEHYNAHVNFIDINKYKQQILEYCNKLVYISQYIAESDIKKWFFDQDNI